MYERTQTRAETHHILHMHVRMVGVRTHISIRYSTLIVRICVIATQCIHCECTAMAATEHSAQLVRAA